MNLVLTRLRIRVSLLLAEYLVPMISLQPRTDETATSHVIIHVADQCWSMASQQPVNGQSMMVNHRSMVSQRWSTAVNGQPPLNRRQTTEPPSDRRLITTKPPFNDGRKLGWSIQVKEWTGSGCHVSPPEWCHVACGIIP
ncbi:hypothetical protein Tco_0816195 [Tanacetum coccineum]